MNTHLFILCPPYSGSTVLWKLIATSKAVSALPSEGQFLPEVKEWMRKAPWNPGLKQPWGEIKKVWDRYWDHSRPVLVEKSPPNLLRVDDIVQHFSPVQFLLMVRNPYAHCEGLIRRNGWDAAKVAEFTVMCLRKQQENKDKLKDALCLTYEELVQDPAAASRKIETFLPQLGPLDPGLSMKVRSIDGVVERGFVDLNGKKLHNLSVTDLKQVNRVLRRNEELMAYWGYEFYEPTWRHALAFYQTRGGLLLKNAMERAGRLAGRLTGLAVKKA